MSGLFKPKMPAAPAVPQTDDAATLRDQRDRALRRGRGSTILTGDRGLPDLGVTRAPTAGGQ